jgi:hypothetical protein
MSADVRTGAPVRAHRSVVKHERTPRGACAEPFNDKVGAHMKLIAVLLMTLPLYVACEKQGPLERAAEEVDEAIEDVKNGGETVGNKVDDSIDDARDGVEDAADELKR